MLAADRVIPVADLDLGRVRAYLAEKLPPSES
jgi:hypothetical protein